MAEARRVVFEFDERSTQTLDDLQRQGYEFTKIEIINPATGETRTLQLPKPAGGSDTCPTCGQSAIGFNLEAAPLCGDAPHESEIE